MVTAHKTLPVDAVGELSPNTAIRNECFDSDPLNGRICCVYQCSVTAHQPHQLAAFCELSPNTAIRNECFNSDPLNGRICCVYQCSVTAHQTLPVDVVGELSPKTKTHVSLTRNTHFLRKVPFRVSQIALFWKYLQKRTRRANIAQNASASRTQRTQG